MKLPETDQSQVDQGGIRNELDEIETEESVDTDRDRGLDLETGGEGVEVGHEIDIVLDEIDLDLGIGVIEEGTEVILDQGVGQEAGIDD